VDEATPLKKIMLDDVRPKNAQGGKNVLRLKYGRELKIEPNSEKNYCSLFNTLYSILKLLYLKLL
jgi:hypothetical protein